MEILIDPLDSNRCIADILHVIHKSVNTYGRPAMCKIVLKTVCNFKGTKTFLR